MGCPGYGSLDLGVLEFGLLFTVSVSFTFSLSLSLTFNDSLLIYTRCRSLECCRRLFLTHLDTLGFDEFDAAVNAGLDRVAFVFVFTFIGIYVTVTVPFLSGRQNWPLPISECGFAVVRVSVTTLAFGGLYGPDT